MIIKNNGQMQLAWDILILIQASLVLKPGGREEKHGI